MTEEFPWRTHTNDELQQEFKRLKNKVITPIKFPLSYSTIGYKCSNMFFQFERMKTKGFNRPSSVEYWEKSKDNIIKFSNRVNRDIFSTINFFNHSPSQFPIVTAAKIYRYFNSSHVFDPYAGWGDRCIAAMALDIDYSGIDSNVNLQSLYSDMSHFYSYRSNITFIQGRCETVDLSTIAFDFVFTSPPFWRNNTLLEYYDGTETNYDTFLANSLVPVINGCLNKNVWVCLYISEEMYNNLLKLIGTCTKIIKFRTNNKTIENIYCWNKKGVVN